MHLPEKRTDLRDSEKPCGRSVDVLVRVEGYEGVTIGRYYHGLNEWQLNNHGGVPPAVLEWWPMPKPRTGFHLTKIS